MVSEMPEEDLKAVGGGGGGGAEPGGAAITYADPEHMLVVGKPSKRRGNDFKKTEPNRFGET